MYTDCNIQCHGTLSFLANIFKPVLFSKKPTTIKEICQYRSFALLQKYKPCTSKQMKQRIKHAIYNNMIHYIEWRLRETRLATVNGLSNSERQWLWYYAHRYDNKALLAILEQYLENNFRLPAYFNLEEKDALKGTCKGGHLHLLKQVLARESWDNAVDYDLVEKACASGNLELIKHVITVYNADATSGLRQACKSGRVASVEYLLSCDLDVSNTDYACHLYTKTHAHQQAIIELLKRHKVYNVSAALAGACYSGNLKVIQDLVQDTASLLDWTNAVRNTIWQSQIHVLPFIPTSVLNLKGQSILEPHENKSMTLEFYQALHEKCPNIFTDLAHSKLLEVAVIVGDLAMVQFLYPSKVSWIRTSWTQALLGTACFNGHLPIVKYLLSCMPRFDNPNEYLHVIENCFVHACRQGQFPVMHYMFEKMINSLCCNDDYMLILNQLLKRMALGDCIWGLHFLIVQKGATDIQSAILEAKRYKRTRMIQYLKSFL
jgi:hypothetical protein